jgi:hypothetical protein
MFRNRDDSIIADEQYSLFNSELETLFEDEKFLKKYGFKKDDYRKISNFLFLFHNKSKEYKDNEISRIYSRKVLRKFYSERKKDPDLINATPYEQTIMRAIKKKYLEVQTGKRNKENYTVKTIFYRLFQIMKISGKIDKNLPEKIQHFIRIRLTKKYAHVAKKYMRKLNTKYHQFKNTKEAVVFEMEHSEGVYKNKIDFERLYKYLAVTRKLSSTKEDFQWLSGLVDILYKTGIENEHNDEIELTETDRKDLEKLLEEILKDED